MDRHSLFGTHLKWRIRPRTKEWNGPPALEKFMISSYAPFLRPSFSVASSPITLGPCFPLGSVSSTVSSPSARPQICLTKSRSQPKPCLMIGPLPFSDLNPCAFVLQHEMEVPAAPHDRLLCAGCGEQETSRPIHRRWAPGGSFQEIRAARPASASAFGRARKGVQRGHRSERAPSGECYAEEHMVHVWVLTRTTWRII